MILPTSRAVISAMMAENRDQFAIIGRLAARHGANKIGTIGPELSVCLKASQPQLN